jgi:type II secretory ATPase GspE/PulE/Tfp pilus assembly ATPase PilB-like protein
MMPLDSVPAGRLIALYGVWVALALAWAASCMWIERDARRVFRTSRRWKALLVGVGIFLFLAASVGGKSAVLLTAILLSTAMFVYLVYRESKASRDDRLVRVESMLDKVAPIARILRLQSWLERLRASLQTAAKSSSEMPIVLLKKDGTPYTAAHGGPNREIAEAVHAAQRIVGKAITLRATDIHFEPKSGQEYQVRYRIDGIMQTRQVMPMEDGRAVVSALKVLSDMDIAERRRPQDGTFAACVAGSRFDVRAASGPTNFGEKLSLRMLEADGGIVKSGLAGLGMRNSMAASLRELTNRSHGMLVVSGPTGSGKTTTLYSCLNEIDVLTRNVVTIEDPVEYRLENISQTAVNNAAELTFAKILRSVLRQDPDVILVGEIRDRETAEIALQAALTGHFVLTTLHANDSATTITRLVEIGIDATLIQSAVSAVLAQRLVRLLCTTCKQPYEPSRELRERLGIPADRAAKFFKERGCEECNGTGYRGRTGVYELLVLESSIRSLLVGRPSLENIRAITRKAGMRTLWQSALYKVVSGHTSLAEAERVVR